MHLPRHHPARDQAESEEQREVLINYVRTGKNSTELVNAATGELYYSIVVEVTDCTGVILKIFKPDQDKPFATIKADSVFIAEGSGLRGLTVAKTYELLYKNKRRWTSKRFTVNGHEYKLRQPEQPPVVGNVIQLFDPSSHEGHPPGLLASFEPRQRQQDGASSSGREEEEGTDDSVLGHIRIAAHAVSSSPSSSPPSPDTPAHSKSTLICQGRPTKILDYAVLAEYIYWRNDKVKEEKKNKRKKIFKTDSRTST